MEVVDVEVLKSMCDLLLDLRRALLQSVHELVQTGRKFGVFIILGLVFDGFDVIQKHLELRSFLVLFEVDRDVLLFEVDNESLVNGLVPVRVLGRRLHRQGLHRIRACLASTLALISSSLMLCWTLLSSLIVLTIIARLTWSTGTISLVIIVGRHALSTARMHLVHSVRVRLAHHRGLDGAGRSSIGGCIGCLRVLIRGLGVGPIVIVWIAGVLVLIHLRVLVVVHLSSTSLICGILPAAVRLCVLLLLLLVIIWIHMDSQKIV